MSIYCIPSGIYTYLIAMREYLGTSELLIREGDTHTEYVSYTSTSDFSKSKPEKPKQIVHGPQRKGKRGKPLKW